MQIEQLCGSAHRWTKSAIRTRTKERLNNQRHAPRIPHSVAKHRTPGASARLAGRTTDAHILCAIRNQTYGTEDYFFSGEIGSSCLNCTHQWTVSISTPTDFAFRNRFEIIDASHGHMDFNQLNNWRSEMVGNKRKQYLPGTSVLFTPRIHREKFEQSIGFFVEQPSCTRSMNLCVSHFHRIELDMRHAH